MTLSTMLLQEYQSHWETDFLSLQKAILAGLDLPGIHLEHVGSTAVSSLLAKPLIDMDLVYSTIEDFIPIKAALLELGYFHNGDQGIPGREVFKRKKAEEHPVLDKIAHHLYVCHQDNPELQRHLYFRDRLREDPKLRDSYTKLKIALAEEAQQDRKVYAALKETKGKVFFSMIFSE